MEKIGVVVYRLQLLAGAKLHPVFHCSLLRPHHDPIPIADPKQLPLEVIDNQSVLTPLSILDSKPIQPPNWSWFSGWVRPLKTLRGKHVTT